MGRTFYITTNGYVRDGVLDIKLAIARDILNDEIPSSRLCPLIFKMMMMMMRNVKIKLNECQKYCNAGYDTMHGFASMWFV